MLAGGCLKIKGVTTVAQYIGVMKTTGGFKSLPTHKDHPYNWDLCWVQVSAIEHVRALTYSHGIPMCTLYLDSRRSLRVLHSVDAVFDAIEGSNKRELVRANDGELG